MSTSNFPVSVDGYLLLKHIRYLACRNRPLTTREAGKHLLRWTLFRYSVLRFALLCNAHIKLQGVSIEKFLMADPEVRIAHGEDSDEVEPQGYGPDVEVEEAGAIGGAGEFEDASGVGETAVINGDSDHEDERVGAEDGKSAATDTFVEYVFLTVVMLTPCDFD